MNDITDEMLAEDAEAPPELGHNSLAELSDIVSDHQKKSQQVADLEAEVKELKEQIRKIEMETLPDTMLQIGVETFTTTEGIDITVKPIVTGSIPKKNTVPAMQWLRKNGHEDIIKQVLTLSFSKGQSDQAVKLCTELEDQGFAPTSNESVHTSTLKSWAKEQIENGKVIPLELLGIFHARKAQIKIPKKK